MAGMTTKRMAANMEKVIMDTAGHVAHVKFHHEKITIEASMYDGVKIMLSYPSTATPAECCTHAIETFNKIVGKK